MTPRAPRPQLSFPGQIYAAGRASVSRRCKLFDRSPGGSDSTGVDPARLGQVPAEDLPRLTIRLDPSVSLLASPWPIDQIWRVHQGDAACDRTMDLGAGEAFLEVRRIADAVTMRAVDRATHAFRSALAAGRLLDGAADAAFAADPTFELATALHELIEDGTLVDFAASES
jgi:hypothetical protein